VPRKEVRPVCYQIRSGQESAYNKNTNHFRGPIRGLLRNREECLKNLFALFDALAGGRQDLSASREPTNPTIDSEG
jgi:hypothetical protein